MKKIHVILAGFLAIVMMSACFGGPSSSSNSGSINNNNNNDFDVIGGQNEKDETENDSGLFDHAPTGPVSVSKLNLNDFKPVVTKEGTISNTAGLNVAASMLVNVDKSGDMTEYTLLSYKGESLLSKKYHNYEYFGNGITAAYYYSDTVPQCSLVNIHTGKVYLDDNACKIEQISQRFYKVIYTTEKTDSKEDAFIYFTDRMFAIAPQEGDVLYKGYAKIFDAEAGSFVGDYIMEKPTDVFVCNEETLLIEIDWSTSNIYAANGTLVAENVEDISVCQNYFVQETREGTTIYDSSFNPIRKLAEGEAIEEDGESYDVCSGKYLATYDSEAGLEGVIDMGGNTMIEPAFDTVFNTFHDYIIVSKEINGEDYQGVYLADGTEIVPCEYDGAYGHDTLPLIRCFDDNRVNYVYVPGHGIINLDGYRSTGDVYYKQPNENDYRTRSYLVYATGELVTYKDADVIMDRLLVCDDGLLDLLTGQILISAQEFNYDQVMATEEYVYGYNASTKQITIYKVEM